VHPGAETRPVRRPRALRRTLERFLEDPSSIRNAGWLIVGATVAAVLAGGVVVWLLDHDEYPTLGRALWFTLQTATTVGYGDVTPRSVVGRSVAAVVMLTAIGFITIVTAAVTSTFVEAGRRKAERATEASDTEAAGRSLEALAAITARLDRIEETLEAVAGELRSG
jgi:voltage-gated potassium channel